MNNSLRIDFVSDVACPWCVIGLLSLEEALRRAQGELAADIHFQPFELNPQLSAAGEDMAEHLMKKYRATAEQSARSREAINARGKELGFGFALDRRTRIYNTFDAHRLLHWADLEGRQKDLAHALFAAYFSHGKNPSDHDVLVEIAVSVGLDGARSRAILSSDLYVDGVRARERFYLEQGIHAVPAVIINERHLIQGGQEPEVFERAMRQMASA
jgi:predicted DsbA family dithiol-disulfide isomerase